MSGINDVKFRLVYRGRVKATLAVKSPLKGDCKVVLRLFGVAHAGKNLTSLIIYEKQFEYNVITGFISELQSSRPKRHRELKYG